MTRGPQLRVETASADDAELNTVVMIGGGLKYQFASSRGLLTAALYQLSQTNVATNDPDHAGFLVRLPVAAAGCNAR